MRPASFLMRLARIGRRGWVAAEFALVAPIFFFVALGTADLIRLFRAQLRTETIAVQLGQIASQCTRITTADLTQFWTHANRIAGGIVDVNTPTTGGRLILSAVRRHTTNASNVLAWQRTNGGNVSHTSSVGATENSAATIVHNVTGVPAFVVPANQTLFVTEVFAIVRPWPLSAGLIGTFLPSTIGAKTLFLTRARDPQLLQAAPVTSGTLECTA